MNEMGVDYGSKIPNNVGLRDDPEVRAAMEAWHPGYIDWWHDMGPEGFQSALVYLRTTVSMDPAGWAKFDYVRMPEYRWAVLLAPRVDDRRVAFGDHKGEPAWQEVPNEYRSMLLRLLTVQGDAEPASVEQARHLGRTAPSLYDMRNLFQLNVEEARHLWAMVYLMQKYLGQEGREQADGLLRRRAGNAEVPRLLSAFNEEMPDWLSFYMFSFFADRDGKMQLAALAQSAFDPLSRTCRFMLTEEAHHMFIGDNGVRRVIERTCQAMRQARIDDPFAIERVRALGIIDLPTLQKKINLHFSMALDLFGNEVSRSAAAAFNASVKGRFREDKLNDDHQLRTATYDVLQVHNGRIVTEVFPALSALNARLRDDYIGDCVGGIQRWNKAIEEAGVRFHLSLPHIGFNRRIGCFSDVHIDPNGQIRTAAEWGAMRDSFLPSADDTAFIGSLMKPELGPGAFAGWIAPPKTPIDNKPGDFEYVQVES